MDPWAVLLEVFSCVIIISQQGGNAITSNICYSYILNRDAEKYLEDCEKAAKIIPMGTGFQGDGYAAVMLDKR